MKTATVIIIRALASTVYFHTGSSLMSGIWGSWFSGSCGSSGSWVWEFPPRLQRLATRRLITDFFRSSTTKCKEAVSQSLLCFLGKFLSCVPAVAFFCRSISLALLSCSSCSQSRSSLSSLECRRLNTRRWSWKGRPKLYVWFICPGFAELQFTESCLFHEPYSQNIHTNVRNTYMLFLYGLRTEADYKH